MIKWISILTVALIVAACSDEAVSDPPPGATAPHGSAIWTFYEGNHQFKISVVNQDSPASPDDLALQAAALEWQRRAAAGERWDSFYAAAEGVEYNVRVRVSPASPTAAVVVAAAAHYVRDTGASSDHPVTPGSPAGDLYAPVSAAALAGVLDGLGESEARRTDTAEIAASIRGLFDDPTGDTVNVKRADALGLADDVEARESVSPRQISAELASLVEPE